MWTAERGLKHCVDVRFANTHLHPRLRRYFPRKRGKISLTNVQRFSSPMPMGEVSAKLTEGVSHQQARRMALKIRSANLRPQSASPALGAIAQLQWLIVCFQMRARGLGGGASAHPPEAHHPLGRVLRDLSIKIENAQRF